MLDFEHRSINCPFHILSLFFCIVNEMISLLFFVSINNVNKTFKNQRYFENGYQSVFLVKKRAKKYLFID
ncbi:hypothetical protein UB33_19075 [Photobacterium angustum]|nr:hypothetical protein UB39_19605 [Photobacterium angustum]KJG04442.1 hypothetical protein UB33_19075 [Photobacterium angustum]PSV95439.1 hypothetical protein CTN01_04390 [Photobacterium angustum]PSW78898.1 hypothetical protein CTN03_17070 [Photobacterium angustum]